MYQNLTSQAGNTTQLALYASLLLSALSLSWNVVQYLAGKRARAAEVRAREAEAGKTESERKSVDVSTLNTLLKTVNEQVSQVVAMRRANEAERLRDHEEIGKLRHSLDECRNGHAESERAREAQARELKGVAARLAQLEILIRETPAQK